MGIKILSPFLLYFPQSNNGEEFSLFPEFVWEICVYVIHGMAEH